MGVKRRLFLDFVKVKINEILFYLFIWFVICFKWFGKD